MVQFSNDTMHWGGSFSSAEIFAVLYKEVLNCINNELLEIERDKFLLSKGHAALGLYATFNILGMLSDEQLSTYQKDGGELSELMESNPTLGFETSGGSLGINLSYGAGLALLAKRKNYSYKTYVEVGDGELDEGSVWEAIMFASQQKLDNLILIVDANTVQSDGFTKDIISWENLENRLKSFGWNTLAVDGHDCGELLDAFLNYSIKDMPLAIIANTIKGKGISFMENNYLWHDKVISKKELEIARGEIEENAKYGF